MFKHDDSAISLYKKHSNINLLDVLNSISNSDEKEGAFAETKSVYKVKTHSSPAFAGHDFNDTAFVSCSYNVK